MNPRLEPVIEDIRAWLGPAVDELTDAQIAVLDDIAQAINTRHPRPDNRDERDSALTTACRLLTEPPRRWWPTSATMGADEITVQQYPATEKPVVGKPGEHPYRIRIWWD